MFSVVEFGVGVAGEARFVGDGGHGALYGAGKRERKMDEYARTLKKTRASETWRRVKHLFFFTVI